MKKKVILVLMLALLAPAFIFADILQLGVNVGYGPNYADLFNSEEEVDYFAIENFTIAPELRVNAAIFQFDLVPNLSFGEDYFKADTQATVGLSFNLFGVVRIGGGVGISVPIVMDNGTWTIGGQTFDQIGNVLGGAGMIYKVSLGILPLDPVEITANWNIPAEGSFNDGGFAPSIEASTFSVGVLFNLL